MPRKETQVPLSDLQKYCIAKVLWENFFPVWTDLATDYYNTLSDQQKEYAMFWWGREICFPNWRDGNPDTRGRTL